MTPLIETAMVSSPEEDRVYVEFRYDGKEFASLFYRSQEHVFELYPRQDGQRWVFNASEFIDKLQEATESLVFGTDTTPEE